MSKITVAAHQPNFMPYLGFFDKLRKSDIFVIRDEVMFTKRDYHHRNRIRINGNDNLNKPQFHWIGVPVKDEKKYLQHIQINQDAKRGTRHWKKELEHELTTNYGTANYYDEHFTNLMEIVNNSGNSLTEMNMQIINYIASSFKINTNIIMASELGLRSDNNDADSDPSQDLVDICKAVGGDVYLSGDGGKNYLDLTPFKKAGIDVKFQEYTHPIYEQNYDGFLENLSAIDALFCINAYPDKTKIVEHVYEHEY